MFGQNEVTNSFPQEDGRLMVNSIFPTIQGEGPDSGRPAVFMRLSKCCLKCWFCDTEFESGGWMDLQRLQELVIDEAVNRGFSLIVITGGEPLLQNIIPFVKLANKAKISVGVETSGASYIEGLDYLFNPERRIAGNIIVCSPKTPTLNKKIVPLIGAYKYIIRNDEIDPDDGLPTKSTQLRDKDSKVARPHSPDIPVFVQGCDEQDVQSIMANTRAAAKVAMKHNYLFSLQAHKFAGLD